MPKKKESIIEKVKDLAEDVIETTKHIEEDAVKAVKNIIKKVAKESETKPKKEAVKKEDKKVKFASLLEKAKKLEKVVEEAKEIEIKKEVREEKREKKETLVPMEDYLKSSIHLGTKVITPDMRSYVYRRRADGLAVFDTALLDDKLRKAADYIAKFAPEDIIVVCKREAGWEAVKKFSEVTGIRIFTKKYPAGVLTNTKLEDFFETDLVFICDPWLDKNALFDSNRIKIPVVAICDTNNYTKGIAQLIPGNNKSFKSLGMIFYLLAKLYVEKRKLDVKVPSIHEFIKGWDELVPPK